MKNKYFNYTSSCITRYTISCIMKCLLSLYNILYNDNKQISSLYIISYITTNKYCYYISSCIIRNTLLYIASYNKRMYNNNHFLIYENVFLIIQDDV